MDRCWLDKPERFRGRKEESECGREGKEQTRQHVIFLAYSDFPMANASVLSAEKGKMKLQKERW